MDGPLGPVAAEIAQALGVTALTARILVLRGHRDAKGARRFLDADLQDLHDPFLLNDMDAAADRIARAVRDGETIAVFGDYDVDGVTGASLVTLFLRELGAQVLPYVPNRFTEGYGLNLGAVRTLAEAGAKVLITVDCGVTSVEEAALARELGVDLIVNDHHEPGPAIPQAFALLNPKLAGNAFPFDGICGTGVAFHLLMALRARLREGGFFATHPEPNLLRYLDLVAIATVADLVPLVDVNRVLVKYGLREMAKSERAGVRALLEVGEINPARLNAGHLGFQIGPRLNAAGRLGSGLLGLELLTSGRIEDALPLARKLDEANRTRRRIEREIAEDAVAMVERETDWTARRALVYGSERWHQGVVGIVASRLVERFYRPTILIAFEGDEGRGSARSIEGFHLLDCMRACGDHLETYGGHKYAAGLRIRKDRLAGFREAFEAEAAERLDEGMLHPRLKIDAEVRFPELGGTFIDEVERLAPFGLGNARPVFVTRGADVRGVRILRGGHVKLRLSQDGVDFDAIGFGMEAVAPGPGAHIDIAFTAEPSTFGGGRRLELNLKDLRESAA
ncbi:MAG: single-stranded-DNA-specific exonuclease RecJ [Myxococcales bacterium]|nr:single-stranded-DNA-specific exonuclease RecJ [Myxococcales bacterium]